MIMWNCINIQIQVESLLAQYPHLYIAEEDANQILLKGNIDIYREACDFVLQKQYDIEIIIPKTADALPVAVEKGEAVAGDYPHRYADGSLCLETDTYIKNRFIDGIDMVEWMDEFVEPYFFSYEFFCRFGMFPFGERPHGLEGLIHTYQEFWNEKDIGITCVLLRYAAEEIYRGHALCPCNSGKRIRKCHGPTLLPYMRDPRRLEIIKNDLSYLRKELSKYEQSKANNRKTK